MGQPVDQNEPIPFDALYDVTADQILALCDSLQQHMPSPEERANADTAFRTIMQNCEMMQKTRFGDYGHLLRYMFHQPRLKSLYRDELVVFSLDAATTYTMRGEPKDAANLYLTVLEQAPVHTAQPHRHDDVCQAALNCAKRYSRVIDPNELNIKAVAAEMAQRASELFMNPDRALDAMDVAHGLLRDAMADKKTDNYGWLRIVCSLARLTSAAPLGSDMHAQLKKDMLAAADKLHKRHKHMAFAAAATVIAMPRLERRGPPVAATEAEAKRLKHGPRVPPEIEQRYKKWTPRGLSRKFYEKFPPYPGAPSVKPVPRFRSPRDNTPT